MKNLDNIPEKEIFKVPDGYFDTLPSRIQARIVNDGRLKKQSFVFAYKLQYIIPTILLLGIGVYWHTGMQNGSNAESILASVKTEELIAYLHETELTTEDVLNNIEFNMQDVQDIEAEAYELNLDNDDLQHILGDFEIENF